CHWVGNIPNKYNIIHIRETNELLSLMRYRRHFRQGHIIMIYDIGTHIYAPSSYALMKFKRDYLYCTIQDELIALSE
ncbi:hypothetical protein HZS_7029, partial [Henneguya salminicola]